jgi:hypothetical protein
LTCSRAPSRFSNCWILSFNRVLNMGAARIDLKSYRRSM